MTKLKEIFFGKTKPGKEQGGTRVSCVGECSSHLVVSDSLRHHGMQPARLLCPWDFPGKNIGVGCHFLLQGIFSTHGSNLHLLHWEAVFTMESPGKPQVGLRNNLVLKEREDLLPLLCRPADVLSALFSFLTEKEGQKQAYTLFCVRSALVTRGRLSV